MWKKVPSLRLLRQKTTVSLLKAVSDSYKSKVKKYLYPLWILGKRASQGLSSLLQLLLKMLELRKLLLNAHSSSHFWQDRRCSSSQPGSSGLVAAFSKQRWLTAHLEAVSSSHGSGLQWAQGPAGVGRAQMDPGTHPGHGLASCPPS